MTGPPPPPPPAAASTEQQQQEEEHQAEQRQGQESNEEEIVEEEEVTKKKQNLKFEGNLWNQYDKIHARIRFSRERFKELHVLLEKNKKGMESYVKVVKKLKLTTGAQLWGVNDAMVGVSNYYKRTEQVMDDASDKEHLLHKELREFKNDMKHTNAHHEKTLNRLKKELDGFRADAQSKAKADKSAAEGLKKAVQNLQKAREEKNPDKQKKLVEKGEALLEQAKKKSIAARDDYAKSIKTLRLRDARYYKGLDDLLNEIEVYDRERLQKTKNYLTQIATIQFNMNRALMESAADLKERAEAINIDEDINNFIEQTRDDETPPAPDDFVPYFATRDQLDDPINAEQNKQALNPEEPLGESAEPQEYQPNSPQQEEEEQTNKVEKKAPPPLPPTNQDQEEEEKVIEVVKAAFEYEDLDDPEALTFKVGDSIEVLSKEDGEWWRGRLNGKIGVFPFNYMEGYVDQEVEEEVIEEVIVEFDYTPQADEELDLQAEDVISVLHKHEDGWHEGINKRTGERGLFPANYARTA